MKRLTLALLAVFSTLVLMGCRDKEKDPVALPHIQSHLSESTTYNTDLFYLNALEFEVADPTVIYVEEGEEAGYFYAYGTSDDIRVYGIQSWRSKDMTHWESMGVALKPDFNETWAVTNYWAPEVIYDENDGLYYMFYSAQTLSTGVFQMSVAYSADPQGPFISPHNIRNADGKMLRRDQPVYDFTAANPAIDPDIVRRNTIDISPFEDPVTGDKFIYFSYYDTFNQSEIFGLRMKDWFTPEYDTLTQLTAVGYLSVEAGLANDITKRTPEGTINEGPYMIYRDGTYYMTLSVYGYTDEKYQVRQALSNDPLGSFEKILPEEGGTVIATDPMWTHVTSAGHHMFVEVGDELYIAYHTFLNRSDITDGRALAFDKVEMVEKNGISLLHSNGPSYSLQPLPEMISGYTNIATDATVTSDNTAAGSNTSYLNDGVMSYLSYDIIPEYEADEGVTTITLTWDGFVSARAIMVYNSIHYDSSFLDVARIRMTYLENDDETRVAEINDLDYDWDFLVDTNFDQMNPGGAVVAEFNDLPVNKIEITIASVQGSPLAIPEIVVLGQDEPVAPVSSFQTYTYDNPVFPSPELVTEGTTIGSNNGLSTDFGYDLTDDDGSVGASVTQTWPYDQYAYFKDVWSTRFYVEAEFTVTNDRSYANDPYPKFGLTVASPENTIFFFVDADPTYTRDAIGVAQRRLDNSDWDWNATEQNVTGPGISYRDGDTVKLSIIRDGNAFYMLANDQLFIYYDQFNVFNATYEATAGFLTFNTEVLITDYMITDDDTVIDQKIDQYAENINGETLGMSFGYKTTSGWDLSTDDGTEDAYVENTLGGDQYVYFRDFRGSVFTAETKLTVTQSLGDPFPKFGIVLRNGTQEFFYFIESNTSFNQNRVGYVSRGADGNWDWANMVSFATDTLTYKDGGYTTLALSYDNGTITLSVNGVTVTTIGSVPGFEEGDLPVVGILSFTTGIRITDYTITTG